MFRIQLQSQLESLLLIRGFTATHSLSGGNKKILYFHFIWYFFVMISSGLTQITLKCRQVLTTLYMAIFQINNAIQNILLSFLKSQNLLNVKSPFCIFTICSWSNETTASLYGWKSEACEKSMDNNEMRFIWTISICSPDFMFSVTNNPDWIYKGKQALTFTTQQYGAYCSHTRPPATARDILQVNASIIYNEGNCFTALI